MLDLIKIEPTWDYMMIPSERPLYAILGDVVQHGVDHPTHGFNCSCLDEYVYEVRRHVHRALPGDQYYLAEDWDGSFYQERTRESREARMRADNRIAHVLRLAAGLP